jgi:AcrR family transcriptional regulator
VAIDAVAVQASDAAEPDSAAKRSPAASASPAAKAAGEQRAAAGRSLSGEKAQRIVEAMRRSVALRGTAGSTFDHVSREAGVSRGLLHYYFGTKEQLLVEAVRRDCELRMELLERQLAAAKSADDYIDLMAQTLQETVHDEPEFVTLLFELFTLARRNEDIAAEYGGLMRRMRDQVTAMLVVAQRDGILRLHAEPEAVAEVLFSLGDGLALRMLAEPQRDFDATVHAGILAVRALLTD